MAFFRTACVCLVFAVASCYADVRSESDLRRALFENYDKLVRPVRSVTDIVPVRAELIPVGIKDVDVKDKTVKLDTWLYIRWQDQYLSWDPSLYGGLQTLRLPAEEVWIPDLAVYYGTPDTSLFPTVHSNVVIYHNGTVLWVPPFTVKSRCPPTENQVTEDTFQCTISVGSWTYDVTLLDVQEYETDVLHRARESSFQDTNKDWSLESMTARTELKLYSCCIEEYPVIRFDLLLKKKPRDHHHNHD